jgi:hypothetical protein
MIVQVEDLIDELYDGRDRVRSLENITTIIVHRIGEEVGVDAREISLAFRSGAPSCATWGENPYHFLVWPDGKIQQIVPLDDASPHARRFNHVAIGIGTVGDFRKHKPTPQQAIELAGLCATLCAWRPSLGIEGHTDTGLTGSTSDPFKSCPGKHLSIDKLRELTAKRRMALNSALLVSSGIRKTRMRTILL